MKNEKRAPVPPFRYGYLLTVDRFIAYCNERGVRTDKKQLEYYDQQNLLVPVAGIYHPVGVYKRVKREDGTFVYMEHDGDPNEKRYYHSEGIGIGAPQYTVNYLGLVAQVRKPDERFSQSEDGYCEDFEPAFRDFTPWKDLAFKNPNFVENEGDLGQPVLLCYSPEQIFPLVEIQSRLKLSVSDGALFRSKKDWVAAGENIKNAFAPNLLSLKSHIQNYYDTLCIYFDAEDLWFKLVSKEREKFNKKMATDPYASEITKADLDARVRTWQQSDKRTLAKKLLKKHGVSEDQLRKMAELFIYPAFFKDPNIEIWEVYRERIPLYWIQKQKGVARLCEDFYRVAERLLWLLSEAERKSTTLKDYYQTRSIRFMESCVVCGTGFNRTKVGGRKQVTCGSKNCVNKNRNLGKQEKRLK